MSFHRSITFPDAIQFKKHNFQSVSGPRECMVQVPLRIQPYHRHSGERPPGCSTWTCVSPWRFLGQMVSGEWGYFSCCFYAQLLKMTEDFSLFDSICVIFIFQFFLKIIVYNLALFFFFFKHLSRRSQRPLATLGWRPKDFSLVSDCLSALWRQLVASLLRYWLDLELEVYQILGGPQGRLSKANTRPPSPAALTSYQNKVHWGLVPPPLEICLLKIPPFLFSGFFFCLFVFFISNCGRRGLNTSNDKRSVVKLNTPRVNQLVWHLFFMSRAPCASSILVLTLIVTLLVWLCSVKICNWLRITVGVHSYSTKSPQVFWAGVD